MEIKPAIGLDTGSTVFNELLGGGLPTSSITDVYGAAATGKTQFAFQNALFASQTKAQNQSTEPLVVFVDCAGSFRPERIVEMAEVRGFSTSHVLDRISSIYVRSVSDQHQASEKILTSDHFRYCKLVIVDDVTTNFVAEYSGRDRVSGEEERDDEEDDTFIQRHYELSKYSRTLAYLALRRNLAVLFTNSARSTVSEDDVVGATRKERETTGEIIAQFSLFRLHFSKIGSLRRARVIQPYVTKEATNFEVQTKGIVP